MYIVLYLCAFDRPRRGLCFERDMTLSGYTKRTRNTLCEGGFYDQSS